MSDSYRRYLCRICGYIYDEAAGDPDGGLPPGTRYEDIPDDWECPECGVSKADFEPLEPAPAEPGPEAEIVSRPGDLPADPAQIVVIGGGMAGWALVEAVRRRDADVPIVMISRCSADVYPKPQLSAAAARGRSADTLVRASGADQAERAGITLLPHTRVLLVDTARRRLITPRGGIPYARLVLASGASQIRPDLAGSGAQAVFQINDLGSYRAFRAAVDCHESASVLILGAGLIGCEFADDLAAAGHRVTLVDQAERPLARLLPEAMSDRLCAALAARGVEVLTSRTVERVEKAGEALSVLMSDGEARTATVMLSALGLRPALALAKRSGLRTGLGICVDRELRTSAPDVFALGDCAEHDGRVLPYVRPLREQAAALARTLTGDPASYRAHAGTVMVKTGCLPLAVWAPDQAGLWRQASEDGLVMECLGDDGRLTGFALAGNHTRRASEFESRVGS
ncbi:MAG: FAD-dependent oxidoreductase [Ectothiorhodospiraceae bacterium]|nr:FAD-dependent oxidoreductase [Ectothiorhodospiraceae bacterium]MCH8505276.1 FAD-dependent oxidoreductase [Ectothiorhodospiraceae bacterium]